MSSKLSPIPKDLKFAPQPSSLSQEALDAIEDLVEKSKLKKELKDEFKKFLKK